MSMEYLFIITALPLTILGLFVIKYYVKEPVALPEVPPPGE